MRLRPKYAWFLAFTAAFAVLAGFVFWGTWSLDACPVMPDSPMTFPVGGTLGEFLRRWVETGLFMPYDIKHFIGSPYFWQELQYVLGVYFAGLGLAYFLRGRGVSLPVSFAAGLLLSFCGYWLTLFSAGHGTWFHWMLFGVFVFGLADRAVRNGKLKDWILLGACLAWGSFTQIDLWLLFSVFAFAYFVRCCVRERKMPSARGLVAAAVVFAAIGTPAFLAAFRAAEGRDAQIDDSKGTALSGGEKKDDVEARWIFVTNWSLPPAESAEFFIPRLNGDTSCQMTLALGRQQRTGVRPYTGALGRPLNAPSGNYRQHSLYVGFITCLLALFALVSAFFKGEFSKRRGEILFFAFAACVFWLFSMGRYCAPVYRVVYALPFGDYLRAPVKWHHLTEFSLCVLAGFGLDALRAALSRRFSPKAALAAVCVIALVGACDLARIDRLYCAVVDLKAAKAPNPAADEIVKRGGGKTLDLLEGGSGLVSRSFSSRDVSLTADIVADDVRFIWASLEQLNNKGLAKWIKGKGAVPVGLYTLSRDGIRVAGGGSANVALLEIPSVPAPAPKPAEKFPPVTFVTWLGIASLVSTLFALSYGAVKS